MMNIIDNTIMNYSLLWPGSADGVVSGSTVEGSGMGQNQGAGSIFVSPQASQSGRGWLPTGMGQNVDLMV
jgi:hypothetical protein